MKLFREFAKSMYLPKMPFWMLAVCLIVVVATWIPLAFIAKARTTETTKPPVNIFQDMDIQPRFEPQSINPIFNDQRAMRYNPEGTVSIRQIINDPHFEYGYEVDTTGKAILKKNEAGTLSPVYYEGYPKRIKVNEVFLNRGRRYFNVYCYPCHGLDGQGNGPVNKRALELVEVNSTLNQWITASNMIAINPQTGQLTYGKLAYPNGELFNTITNGIRNMKGYGEQIPIETRWAIVAYIRALQISQHGIEKPIKQKPIEHSKEVKNDK